MAPLHDFPDECPRLSCGIPITRPILFSIGWSDDAKDSTHFFVDVDTCIQVPKRQALMLLGPWSLVPPSRVEDRACAKHCSLRLQSCCRRRPPVCVVAEGPPQTSSRHGHSGAQVKTWEIQGLKECATVTWDMPAWLC
eukprot:884867-Amphidinium_carterae.1